MGISSIQRKKAIRELIAKKGDITVAEIVSLLGVSEVTGRKYLEELEDEKFLLRTYGGAVLNQPSFSGEFFFGEKAKKNIQAKRAIAKKAFSLITENETIFLDTGTTIFELSRLIKNSGKKLVVATNSLSAVSELSQSSCIKLFVLGGFLRRELMDFSGTFIREEISHLNFNQAFLGIDGLSSEQGLTTTDIVTAGIEEAVMQKSQTINILADFSKIGRISLIPYGKLEIGSKKKKLITDAAADKKELEKIRDKFGFQILKAKAG